MSFLKIDRNVSCHWTCELDRPAKLNALSKDLIRELGTFFVEAQDAAAAHKLRVLSLLSTHPKAFCVGADLSERKAMGVDEVGDALDSLRALMYNLSLVSCPTIACIEGAAFGGGLELALCCDMRVCSSSAQMGLTETRLGIIPGAGGTQRLSRLVGVAKAKELIFTGRRIVGEEAHQIGLVNYCSDRPREWLQEQATQIIEGAPVALRAAKQAINNGTDLILEKALDEERSAYNLTLNTQDRVEGLKAFEEKRKPNYQGQ